MAQFDVYASVAGREYLLDVQSPILDNLNTRIVVPLVSVDAAPVPAARLNPQFDIDGTQVRMLTQFMAAAPVTALRRRVGRLADERYAILGAIDFLLTGI
jgi:toxin CcdB